MRKITLTEGAWNLRGASSHAELEAIINDLHEHTDGYDRSAARLQLPRETVANVGRWYQSLWMHA